MNIRETAGLAYAIYSDFNPYTQLLMVEAGVEERKLDEVAERVTAELTRLQTTLVTTEELIMIKRLMRADYLTALDQPGRIMERIQNQALVGLKTTPDEWLAAIDTVTAEQVRAIAQRVSPQLRYELVGGAHD